MAKTDPRDEAAYFFLSFRGDHSFRVASRGPGPDVAELLLHLYLRLKIDGLLNGIGGSRWEVDIEDKSTMRNYVARATQLGLLA